MLHITVAIAYLLSTASTNCLIPSSHNTMLVLINLANMIHIMSHIYLFELEWYANSSPHSIPHFILKRTCLWALCPCYNISMCFQPHYHIGHACHTQQRCCFDCSPQSRATFWSFLGYDSPDSLI